MRDRATSLIAGLVLLAIVGSTWWAADYARRSIPVDPPRRVTHEMDSFIDHFVMTRTDETGLPAARLEGPRAEHYPDDDSYEVRQPRAISQRPDRSVTVATAENGRMDQDGARIVLKGDVAFRRPPANGEPGLLIESEQITLLPNEDVAFTELPAAVTRGDGSRITGTGMQYDNSSRQLTVSSDARVKIAPRAPEAND
ncbi:LPS export ABC transporter periplasmic protein LptC [Verticiella sediminum]|uniref:LPS export ABC transporter periplasmic protein LptC n=1 Tax=Verticiella sediminum TaxID=1247510 RepID=A0A556AB66_9BURK|nr:LPS export ABC transporter periplasmic protein LptC [Verticiella sediminum]TSH90135.1 LPS export ABC transporter periplasmic protein LptC [Verticiella sediminum]